VDWEFVWALILLPIQFVGRILKSKFGIVLVVILVVIIFVVPRLSPPKQVPEFAKNVPSIKQAPTLVQTSSRQYYVQKYVDDGKVLTLQVFYAYDKNWQKYSTPLAIDRAVYRGVSVTKRVN